MPSDPGPPRSFADDDRGLAFAIVAFVGTIVIGFLLAIAIQPGAETMLDIAGSQTTRESSATGQGYVTAAWSNLHLIVIGLGAIQLIAAAAYEAQLGGGRL